MKILYFISFLIILLVPQTIFAQTFFITGEGRGAFLYDTKIALAEDINKKPIFMHFKDRASFRVGAGMKFMENFDVGFFYTNITNIKQYDNRSMANTHFVGIDLFRASADAKIHDESSGNASASLGIKTFDIELGYTMKLKRVNLRLMAGLRHTTHKMRFDGFRKNDCFSHFNKCSSRTYDFHRIIDLKNAAIGPRIGLSFEVPLPIENYDLKFVGAINGAFLISNHNWSHDFEIITTVPNQPPFHSFYREDSDFKATRISTSLDLEGGIKFTHKLADGITLETTAGYRFDGYYGEMFTASIVDRFTAQLPVKYGQERDDVLIHGPFLRTSLRF